MCFIDIGYRLRCQCAAVSRCVTSHHHEFRTNPYPQIPPLIALHEFPPFKLEDLSYLQEV
jgi:hypothetical protein